MKAIIVFIAPLALSACSDADDVATGETLAEPAAELPLDRPAAPTPAAAREADLAALRSEDCTDAAQFYFENLSAGEYDRAALAWDDTVVDGARLSALLNAHQEPQIRWEEPDVTIGEGMPVCTVNGTLVDAADPDLAPQRGRVIFTRVLEAETSDGRASRWRIDGQTFIEPVQRASRGDG